MKRILCLLLAGALLCLAGCGSLSKAERNIKKRTGVGLDLSGCRVVSEKDSHGGFLGDGEYLLVLDCSGSEDKLLAQTGDWSDLPLSDNIRTVLYDWGVAENCGMPAVSEGRWYFYDRFADDAALDRRSDAKLLSRPAENFSLLLYDSGNSILYYFEMDT